MRRDRDTRGLVELLGLRLVAKSCVEVFELAVVAIEQVCSCRDKQRGYTDAGADASLRSCGQTSTVA